MENSLRVLVIEDMEDDAMLLLREIRKAGYVLSSRRVDTEADLQAALKAQSWDIVFADYVLPQFSGIRAIQVVRAFSADLPCIMVSGKAGEETAVEAMKAGATDFLLKGKLSRIGPVIERELRDAALRKEKANIEKELDFKREQYRILFEAADDAIFLLDNNHIADCNRMTLELFGLTKEEVVGCTPYELSPKMQPDGQNSEDAATVWMNKALSGSPQHFEWVLKNASGNNTYVDISLSPLMMEGKSMLLAILRDISKRKLDEEVIRKSEEKYRLLFSEMLSAFSLHEIILDENGVPVDYTFLDVNPAFEKHTGLKAVDVIGKTAKAVLPNIEQYWLDAYGSVALTGRPMEFENYSSDLKKYFDVRAYAPEPGKFAVAFDDITERRKAHELLGLSEQKFRFLAERMRDMVWTTDLNFNTTYVSPSVKKVLGFTVGERLQQDPLTMMTPESHKKATALLAMEMMYDQQAETDKERSVIIEIDYYHKDGHIVPMECNVSFVRNENENIIGLYGLARDISSRKISERNQKLVASILNLLNQPEEQQKIIETILELIQESTGIEAVGIRLKEGEDYPFHAFSGYPQGYKENFATLITHNKDNEIVRDERGCVYLDCLCGNVISGFTDDSLPVYTNGGSFMLNSLEEFDSIKEELQFKGDLRGHCIHEGFESMAMIPLKSGGEIIGILQLNDHRPRQFTGEIIKFYEEIASSIGIAMKRMQDIENLKKARAEEVKHLKTLEMLSKTAMGFVQLKHEEDMGAFIGRKVYDLAPDATVIVASYEKDTKIMKGEALVGAGKNKDGSFSGIHIHDLLFDVPDSVYDFLYKGKLDKQNWPKTISSIASKKDITDSFAEFIRDKDVYNAGLVDNNQLFGALIIVNPKDKLINRLILETLISQAAVAINKRNIVTALKQSENRFRSLFEKNNDVIFTFDSKEALKSINPIGEKLITGKITPSTKLQTILTAESYRKLKNSLNKAYSVKEKYCSEEIEMFARNGNILSFQLSFSITYYNDKPLELFGIARNITQNILFQNQVLSKIIETEEREKKSFAEELHDGLGALLATINIYVTMLQKPEKTKEQKEAYLEQLKKLVHEAVTNIRLFVNTLTPNVLSDFGLVTAAKLFVDKINITRPGLIEFDSPAKFPRFDKIIEINLYRILLELINNTMKYAEASSIKIKLSLKGKKLLLHYEDNGKGFDIEGILASNYSGMGVKNLFARVKSLNGIVDYISTPGKGTRVDIEVVHAPSDKN
ncbi:MAG: PAS domain S-box protein [Bacteroidota bacterium]